MSAVIPGEHRDPELAAAWKVKKKILSRKNAKTRFFKKKRLLCFCKFRKRLGST
jgi:hypothetical protein